MPKPDLLGTLRPDAQALRVLQDSVRRGKVLDRAPGEGNAPIVPAYDDQRLQTMVNYLYVPPRGEARRTANLSVANNTVTAVSMQEEVHDTDDMVDISGNPTRITISRPGFYYVYGRMTWAANGTGGRWGYVRLNGVTTLAGNVGGVNGVLATYVNVSFMREFAAADYIELMVIQSSGGNLNLTATADESPYFGAYWAGANS